MANTLISLINVESTLTNFEKFHPPQNKNPPSTKLLFPKLHKSCLSQSLAVKATCLNQYLNYLNAKIQGSSCNIPTSTFFILQLLHPLHVYSNLHVYQRDKSTWYKSLVPFLPGLGKDQTFGLWLFISNCYQILTSIE